MLWSHVESNASNDATPAVHYLHDCCAFFWVHTKGLGGQGRAGQGRAGQGRAGQGRASNICSEAHATPFNQSQVLLSTVSSCQQYYRNLTANLISKGLFSYLYDMAHWGVPSPPMGAGTCQLVSQSKVSR